MKLLVGMSNLSQPVRPKSRRSESARLTQALVRKQMTKDEEETVDVRKALRSAQAKMRKPTNSKLPNSKPPKNKPQQPGRWDLLAEAKVLAAAREWKSQIAGK